MSEDFSLKNILGELDFIRKRKAPRGRRGREERPRGPGPRLRCLFLHALYSSTDIAEARGEGWKTLTAAEYKVASGPR